MCSKVYESIKEHQITHVTVSTICILSILLFGDSCGCIAVAPKTSKIVNTLHLEYHYSQCIDTNGNIFVASLGFFFSIDMLFSVKISIILARG